MEEKQRPKVGIGVMIFKDGKVLMGKRKNAHGEGEYAWPGGYLEVGESFESCAKRETIEETGIEICNIRFLRLMNFFKSPDRHYADIGLTADWESGEPKVMKPEEITEWKWYNLNGLPEKVFQPSLKMIKAYLNNKIYN